MKNYKVCLILIIVLSFTSKGFSQYIGGGGSGFAMAETAPASLGIKPVVNEIGIRLSPNPTKTGQNANLKFDKPLNTNTVLIIMDLTGRVFRKETIAAGSNQYLINTSGMQAGVYIIKVVSGEYEMERKLTIL